MLIQGNSVKNAICNHDPAKEICKANALSNCPYKKWKGKMAGEPCKSLDQPDHPVTLLRPHLNNNPSCKGLPGT